MFESHKPGVNDTLGALAGELDSALVFKQSLCVGQATFPTLEGLLFDSPLNPITQSRYGRHVFDFSRMLEYKKAGYRTIFLTASCRPAIPASRTARGVSVTPGCSSVRRRF